MATQVQIRRGTSSQVAAFTGAEGEIVVNTTNSSVHVNNGSTAGGFELARADLNNVSDTDLNAALTGNTVSALTVTTLTAGAFTSNGIDDNADATAITIDANENVLVGKTAVDTNTAGFEARSTGFIGVTRADVGAYFTRLSTDGEIIQFRKGSEPVGSIGTVAGDMFVGTSSTGVRFLDANNEIIPITVSSGGGSTDGTISLGGSPYRFKDLYLSGGVVFGSTGGAVTSKTLDDYEEGTWTPSITGCTITVIRANYVKIGALVHISFTIDINSTDGSAVQIGISGAPFTASVASVESTSTFMAQNVDFPDGTIMSNLYRFSRSGDIAFYVTSDDAALSALLRSSLSSSSKFWGSIVMQTDG